MGMVVRSNIMALNANRQLGMNNTQVGKSLEKLSSGFKINRAGDDASGLAISEKMKAQIKGLETASANSQDGISLVQTAEGALTEVHSMLNRMVELATKSANGTMQDDVDRDAIQSEVDALLKEVDRIGDSTNFNGINLLDGSLSGTASTAAGVPNIADVDLADTAAVKSAASTANFAAESDTVVDNGKVSMTVNYADANGKAQSVTVDMTVNTTDHKLVAADGTEYAIADTSDNKATKTEFQDAFLAELKKTDLSNTFSIKKDTDAIKFEAKAAGANTKIDSIISDLSAEDTTTTDTLQTLQNVTEGSDAYQSTNFASNGYEIGQTFSVGGKKFAFVNTQEDAVKLGTGVNSVVLAATDTIANDDVQNMADLIEQKTGYAPTVNITSLEFKAPTGSKAAIDGLTLQIGDSSDSFNKMTVSVDDMRSAGLGVAGLDVSTADSASDAIQTIKDAINKVSTNRANMGALQNRLEYTINNLDVSSENLTAANSRIRDTDMAKEMMAYTKMNVLTQSAQAMLAQANQQPQSILQLLQ